MGIKKVTGDYALRHWRLGFRFRSGRNLSAPRTLHFATRSEEGEETKDESEISGPFIFAPEITKKNLA